MQRPDVSEIDEEELLKAVVLIDIAQKIGGEIQFSVEKRHDTALGMLPGTFSINGSFLQHMWGHCKMDLSIPGSLDKEKLEEFVKNCDLSSSSGP